MAAPSMDEVRVCRVGGFSCPVDDNRLLVPSSQLSVPQQVCLPWCTMLLGPLPLQLAAPFPRHPLPALFPSELGRHEGISLGS